MAKKEKDEAKQKQKEALQAQAYRLMVVKTQAERELQQVEATLQGLDA